MKKYNVFVLLILSIILFNGCSSSDEGGTEDDPINPNSIQAAFEYEISASNPFALLLNNTTDGDGYEAYWDFGKGEGLVEDLPGIEEVNYFDEGEYTISLVVLKDGLSSTATSVILVDDNGICPDNDCGEVEQVALKDASTSFNVGMITRTPWLNAGGQYSTTIIENFNNISAEYEMKMDQMYPSQGNYNFSAVDQIVGFAQANDMEVHGHVLIWHSATPDWVENFTGTDQEFEDMVEDYITTTIQRYGTSVRSWDVVNEAIEDGTNTLRNTVFRQRMGDNYIQKCFQFARNADPNVLLFYNDYNVAASPGKRNAIFDLVDSLGDLIDGVGAQMHISVDGPSASNIQAVADNTVSRGLLLHFSELDIRTNTEEDENVSALSSSKAQAQRDKYEEVVEIYSSIPQDNKFALTVWGLRDSESWLLDFWGVPDWPLLFDDNYNKKAAYDGFLDGLQ